MGKDTTFLSQISGNSYKFCSKSWATEPQFCCKSVASEAFLLCFLADEFMEITFICMSICDKDTKRCSCATKKLYICISLLT